MFRVSLIQYKFVSIVGNTGYDVFARLKFVIIFQFDHKMSWLQAGAQTKKNK